MDDQSIPLSCLLIDDDEADADLFERCLKLVKGWKASLDVVRNFEDGEARIDTSDYDLVFVDNIVGHRRGTDFIRKMHESYPSLSMVMITGSGSEDIEAKSRRFGATDYLAKYELSPATIHKSISYVMDQVKEQQQINDMLTNATTDQLTGFMRKEYLIRRLTDEVARFTQFKFPLSLLFIDIDNLKHVNDEKGHLQGDAVIKDTALQIRSVLRDTDICGRYGGDELIVALPNTTEHDAHVIAERICQKVASSTEVTLSIGVARCDESVIPLNKLLALADSRAYQAKKAGGNTVVSSHTAHLHDM